MPVIDRIHELQEAMADWRHEIHQHPETAFEEVRTADFVADKLTSFGIEIHRGLAKTGVVGTLRAGGGNRAIGLRADMDALDLQELTDLSYQSVHAGKMHACGHDGHTAMLLGAAKYLAESKDFDGIVYFIFQPAEENLAGARVMISDGLFEQFPVEGVYGLHNMPGYEVGQIAMRVGPLMASADFFSLEITGVGGHGAFPHRCKDPVLAAAQIVTAWQSIVSRAVDPVQSAVISTTQIHGGTSNSVIPRSVRLSGTTRAFLPEVQDLMETRMREIAEGLCHGFGVQCEFDYDRRYAPTVNAERETQIAASAAARVVGQNNVNLGAAPVMGSEDFGWMLRENPGCYLFLGNGTGEEGGCMVHNPHYDFNDKILSLGASYWVELVREVLPAQPRR